MFIRTCCKFCGSQSNCLKTYGLGVVKTLLRGWRHRHAGLCLGPRFIVSSEGLVLGEMEFAHMQGCIWTIRNPEFRVFRVPSLYANPEIICLKNEGKNKLSNKKHCLKIGQLVQKLWMSRWRKKLRVCFRPAHAPLHMLTPEEWPSSTEIWTCNQTWACITSLAH